MLNDLCTLCSSFSMDLIAKYGPGAKLMLKMGYVPGTGLGKSGSGIVEPIIPELRKKGEGIGMMRVIDEDEEDEDEEEEVNDDSALGFEKSGEYVSDYVVEVELYDIIRGLQEIVELDAEFLEMVDKCKSEEVKIKLYNTLKELRLDASKEKYLVFEIERLNKTLQLEMEDRTSIERMLKIVETTTDNELPWHRHDREETELEEIINILKDSSTRIRKDLMLLAAKYIHPIWVRRVDECELDDIGEFGTLLDSAERFIHIDGAFEEYKNVFLEPLWNKVKKYYNDWEVYYAQAGVGVFEEINESKLFITNDVLNEIVIPKILKEIEQSDEFEWLYEWMWYVNAYKERLADAVGKRIIQLIIDDDYLDREFLNTAHDDMKNWPHGGLNLDKCVVEYCERVSHLNSNESDIFSNETIQQYKVFVETLLEFSIDAASIVYDVVFTKYLHAFEEGDIEIYGLTEIMSYLGLMSDKFVTIVDKIRQLWEGERKPIIINNIKDVVLQWCEDHGKSFIPCNTMGGKDIYSIEGVKVYFEGKVMFTKDGDPIGLNDLSSMI